VEVIGRSETDEGHSINVTSVFFVVCLTSSTALVSALWILFIDESMDEQRTAPFPFLLPEYVCKATRGSASNHRKMECRQLISIFHIQLNPLFASRLTRSNLPLT
jgi:hypothetical protein